VSGSFYNIDGLTGLPVEIPGLRTASLADDPAYTASVTIGAYTFSKFDELGYGHDPLGAGRLPLVVFDGSTFLGAVLDLASADGFELDSDPIALALHYFPTQTVSFNDNGDNFNFGILVDVDAAHAVFTPAPIPEPASWALMILGFGVCGGVIRGRRQCRRRSSFGASAQTLLLGGRTGQTGSRS
jgi:hypothetical protein